MTTTDCCGHGSYGPPLTEDAVTAAFRHTHDIEPLLEELASKDAGYRRVLRCRTCGKLWAKDSKQSGQVELEFVYPIETDEDPQTWLATHPSLWPYP